MSTAVLPTPSAPPPSPQPATPRPLQLTCDDLEGISGLPSIRDRKVILIDGEVLEMAFPSVLASISQAQTENWLRTVFPADQFWVRGQLGMILGINTDPIPDIAVVPGIPRQYSRHPRTALLVVEVSDTTVAYDTGDKASLYAAAGIADYWVIDVNDQRLHVFRDPQPDPGKKYGYGYKTVRVLGPKDKVSPLAAPAHPTRGGATSPRPPHGRKIPRRRFPLVRGRAMPETLEFKAELKQLLHLITHSLYSDREIFLRELISNASDAINKVRFDALANADRLEGNTDWKIKLVPCPADGTLTVSDNGVGMSRAEVVENLGTVAQSGTKAFLEAARRAGKSSETPGLIGQFGVGFYSAFMVADRVAVVTRPAGSTPADGTRWESDGQGTFTVEPCEKPARGTDVVLHLKDDAKEFLEPHRLRALVRKFSDFLEFPVVMDVEKEVDGKKELAEETLNSRKAIWLRNRSEVKPEEYAEFYKSLGHDTDPPADVIHYAAEGKTEFKVLAFVPAKKPFLFDWEEPKAGLRLYVRRVLIMDRCEQVLPPYLRFVKGVVDSSDLPLNVSRELLQQNPLLDVIQKSVVKNVLDSLAGMKNLEFDKYLAFYKGFGSVLKEGLTRDWANREKVADLLLFESANTEPGKYTTFADYVAKMPEGQTDVYYLTGESADQLRKSPYLEAFRAKGRDVLLLTDPVDEFVFPQFHSYKGKPLKAADRGDTATGDEVPAELKERYAAVLSYIKGKLPDVSDVRLTTRLTESAACLVADGAAVSAHLERLMGRMGRDAGENRRVLELNPQNPAVAAVRDLHSRDPADSRVDEYARLLYEQAVIAEGSPVPDPVAFARRVNLLIARDAGG